MKPHINIMSALHPVEGSNVVLNCSIMLVADAEVYMKWRVPDERIKEVLDNFISLFM